MANANLADKGRSIAPILSVAVDAATSLKAAHTNRAYNRRDSVPTRVIAKFENVSIGSSRAD